MSPNNYFNHTPPIFLPSTHTPFLPPTYSFTYSTSSHPIPPPPPSPISLLHHPYPSIPPFSLPTHPLVTPSVHCLAFQCHPIPTRPGWPSVFNQERSSNPRETSWSACISGTRESYTTYSTQVMILLVVLIVLEVCYKDTYSTLYDCDSPR